MTIDVLRRAAVLPLSLGLLLGGPGAVAQIGPPGPPAVGVVTVEPRPITERTELTGRIQAPERVDLVARVTAFLEQRLFEEGSEVKKGDLLYRLEREPFEADLDAKRAAVAQAEAQLENANIQLRRAEDLLKSPAGSQARYDDALAAQRSAQAQLKSAQAAERQSRINLGYTEIQAPISGRIGRTAVTAGNVVGPGTGTLATIVSQDPMYVVFPISVRRALELRDRYARKGGFDAVRVRVRLPNGKLYDQIGRLDFADISIQPGTDTITLRATIPNPVVARVGDYGRLRELTDNEFVTVLLEGAEPVEVLAVPRPAILSDQQGNYVYVVGPDNIARVRRVELGQSTPEMASIVQGLEQGERVVTEGVQRVRPNTPVAPAPAAVAVGRG